MKNFYSIIITVFISNFTFAQVDLYVDNDSFIYAKDVVVFVNDDIRLETPTSNFYLRGDAQLLQNTNIKNSDAGELSVYQKQTKGIYEYNYWCSPVGVGVDGATGSNVAFNGTNIHDPDDDTDLANVISTAYSFTSAYNGTVTELSNYWMWSLESAGGYNGWNQIFNSGNVNPGYGFTTKGSPNTNNTLDFRGRPNNGDITFNCLFNGTDADSNSGLDEQVNTLTGNPYPSALDLKLIFANVPNNAARLDGNIYFWEQKNTGSHFLQTYEGGYAVYAPGPLGDLNDHGTYTRVTFGSYDGDGGDNGATSGLSPNYQPNFARRFASIGQGFVVTSVDNAGVAAGGVITLNNSMRVYLPEDSTVSGTGSIFARQNSQGEEVIAMSHNGLDYMDIINHPTIVPEIRIHTKVNDLYYKESVIAFRDNTDLSYNKFCDGKNISQLSDDVYFLIEDHKLVIKSLAYEQDARIPIVFKASTQASTFSITINELTDVDDSIQVYIYDNVANTYTDIKNGSFNISLAEGIYDSRFEVTFNNENTLSNEEITISDFIIFQDNNNSLLTIKNPNSLHINNVSLFDVSGKQVLNAIDLDNKDMYHFSTTNFSDGVYVTVIGLNNNETLSKKLIIKNK
ncbi:T9SS type A sorting domain-containing protein [Psychroserpens ponticola]|uniref:T9SS type A sorting domain-containing protein n=1 Tax=Psychroserpens ponticola TaxID=2932268 RepID=A0ABY7S3I7_9FLAO|nr:T9SS type A sorting domain-containing protein [Psychroserpens ponticola]WCO03016.1 T9SS type A sorting domain-containing protein [Psychroserpens ponticola]